MSLQDKMYNYEVTPPDGVWDKVAAALDEASSEDKFPATLYNIETKPPASAWEAIRSSLYEEDEKVVPLRKRTATFFRYAAAAIIIGVIAFGISIWNNSNQQSVDTAQATLNDTNSIKSGTPSIATEKQEPDTEIAYQDNAEKNPVKTAATKTNRNKTAGKEIINPLYTYEDHGTTDISNRYIMLMTPDGNIIRMSKKWGDMVCCVSGEEQDEDCKQQIKNWQKKLATSPAATSPGNFMDILELVSSLEEGVDL